MIKAMYTSATGMSAQSTVLDNTANNLANINTNGFKKGQADFQDLVYTNIRAPGTDAAQGLLLPTGIQIGSGSRVVGITKVFTPGETVNTGNTYDVAVQGDGFFQVTLRTANFATHGMEPCGLTRSATWLPTTAS